MKHPIVAALIAFIVLCIAIVRIVEWKKRRREDRLKKEKEHQQFLTEKAYYEYLFDNRSPEELSGMPGDVVIGPDGYPKEIGASGWGDRFTFYYSPTGVAYHRKKNCSSYGLMPAHAWTIYNSSRYSCSKCNPELPDMSWYSQYQQILSLMKKYEITPSPYIGPSVDFRRAQLAEEQVAVLSKKLQDAEDEINYYKSFNLEKTAESKADDIVWDRVNNVLHSGLFQGSLVSLDFRQKLKLESNSRLMRAQAEHAEIIGPLSVSVRIKSSSGKTYEVTLDNCSCEDFYRTGRPCKHMYRLALELGLYLSIPTDDIKASLTRLAKEYAQNQKEVKKLKKLRREVEKTT